MGATRFCPVCCTAHGPHRPCPGELRATGPERHGWRVCVETPSGVEAIGILVAPSYEIWRARIITYPNILWAIPGGGGTMKFIGRTAQEAESAAIRFVERHIVARDYLRRDGLAPVEPGKFDLEAAAARSVAARAVPKTAPAERKMRSVMVRFGIQKPTIVGATINVSTGGMFVGTDGPYDAGVPLRLRMDLDGIDLLMQGHVVWNRRRLEAGRPQGMGVVLTEPSPAYRTWVRSIA